MKKHRKRKTEKANNKMKSKQNNKEERTKKQ